MGGKPKKAEDGDDMSCEKFYHVYKGLCKKIGQALSKNVTDRFNEDWHGDV